MTTLAVGVMAHTSRQDQLTSLLERLEGAHGVELAIDVAPASRDPQQRWETGARAWRAAAERGCDWTLVLQDDAVLCDDFVPGFAAALGHLERPAVVSPYMGRGRPASTTVHRATSVADRRGDTWIELQALYWGVAVALPTRVVPDMLSWCGPMRRDNYDARIARFALWRMRWTAMYTWPSLVQHADGPSLVSHSAPGRVAARFLQGSALDVDWTRLPASARGGVR